MRKLTTIGSNNVLVALIGANYYLNQCWDMIYFTHFNEISIKIHKFSFVKIHLKMQSGGGVHFVSAPICVIIKTGTNEFILYLETIGDTWNDNDPQGRLYWSTMVDKY